MSNIHNFDIDGLTPSVITYPESAMECAAVIAEASARSSSVVTWGGGTKIQIGNSLQEYDLALSTSKMNSVLDFRPEEMTITAQAGVTITDLESVLNKANQTLAWNPAYPEKATFGGVLAANNTGGLRQEFGTPKERILELHAALTNGKLIKGGAKVVKSVAGYDIPRLLCGSWGTLGVITEATVKTVPLPEKKAACFIPAGADQIESICNLLFESPLQPVRIDWSSFNKGFIIEFWGSEEAVNWQLEFLTTVYSWSEYDRKSLINIDNLPCSSSEFCVRILCKSSEVESICRNFSDDFNILAHVGTAIIYIFGKQTKLLQMTVEKLKPFKYTIIKLSTELKKDINIWHDPCAEMVLVTKLKFAFDPNDTLSPGRFIVPRLSK